jgi:hypothetical protein
MEWLHDTHFYSHQWLNVASDRMNTCFGCLGNFPGILEGDKVWLYRLLQARGKLSKLQSSWESPYKVITQVSDVVYRIW